MQFLNKIDRPYYETLVGAGESKPWLTMIHGATQHSGLFSAQVDAFRNDYRILLVDLPGHGRSINSPGPFGILEYADSVRQAMRAAAVERTHFWGTHTGASVGLILAANHRHLIRSLILEGATLPGVDAPYVTATVARARNTAKTNGIESARQEWFREAAWFDQIRSQPITRRAHEHWELIACFSGRPWLEPSEAPLSPISLRTIEQPVLLINGEYDVADFILIADTIESGVPFVKRVSIANAGGFPLWELPYEVNAIAKQFLLEN